MNNFDMIPNTSPLVSDELKNQLRTLFHKVTKRVRLVAILDEDDEKSLELGAFLKAIVSCSDNLVLQLLNKNEDSVIQEEMNGVHLPVVGIYNEEGYAGVCFHGIPGGKEMSSFAATICNAGTEGEIVDKILQKQIEKIDKKIELKIFVSLACHHCPHVVVACQKIAMVNKNITADMYDARLYPDMIERYAIERVPMTVVNESYVIMGQKTIEEIVRKINTIL